MERNDTLAEKISNKTEDLSSSFIDMYSDNIGYIKILAISGSILPIILVFTDNKVTLLAMVISFILTLMAMKRIDIISKNTEAFSFMIKSFISYIVFILIYFFFLSSLNYSILYYFSYYFIQSVIAFVATLASTYFYYKSYLEVAKATGLNIFRIAAIMVIISIFVNFISETLSSILIVISTVFIIIGWFGIKTIEVSESSIK